MARELEILLDRLEMSQIELAAALGVSNSNAVSRWQTGRRQLQEPIRRLFGYLNSLPEDEARGVLKKMKAFGAKTRR